MDAEYKDLAPPEVTERQNAIEKIAEMEDGESGTELNIPELANELIGYINNFTEKPSLFQLSYITDFLLKYSALKFEKYIDSNILHNAILLIDDTTSNEDSTSFLHFIKALSAYPKSPFHTLLCDYGIIEKLCMIYDKYADLQDYVLRLFSLLLYDNIPNHSQDIIKRMGKIALTHIRNGNDYGMFKYSLEFIYSCCKNAPYFTEKMEHKIFEVLGIVLNGTSPKLMRFTLWSYYLLLNNNKKLIHEVNSAATISIMLIFDSTEYENIRIALMIMDLLFSYQSIHNYVINFNMFFAHLFKIFSCDDSYTIINAYAVMEKAVNKLLGIGDVLLEIGVMDVVNHTLSEGKHIEKQAAVAFISTLMCNITVENVANLLNDPELDMLYHYAHDSDDPTFIQFANGIISALQKCDKEGISDLARNRLNELEIPTMLEEVLEDCEDEEKHNLAEFVLHLILNEEKTD